MSYKVLKDKPLVEAIIEIRWALTSTSPGVEVDPHYKILLGRFYDRVSSEYSEHEQLPTALIPDEVFGQGVQHRFRVGPNDWPLLQIGPGVMTVNDTHKYTWPDFRSRSHAAVGMLFDAYPDLENLKINIMMLRYINAVDFDYTKENTFKFLKDKMNIGISLPSNLFGNSGIKNEPRKLNWQSSFVCENPQGIVIARFATGHRKDRAVLLWETIVQSEAQEVPSMPSEFEEWLDAANDVAHNWFFTLIEGDLEREFKGD